MLVGRLGVSCDAARQRNYVNVDQTKGRNYVNLAIKSERAKLSKFENIIEQRWMEKGGNLK